jgi:hypothetical protein
MRQDPTARGLVEPDLSLPAWTTPSLTPPSPRSNHLKSTITLGFHSTIHLRRRLNPTIHPRPLLIYHRDFCFQCEVPMDSSIVSTSSYDEGTVKLDLVLVAELAKKPLLSA